ncbi:ABC transporter ATP-binding protein [Reichenbachiella ulvae]|uniref:ABC transporter ATP-binding protein n=1 Tax=Reichenbachiella ulvae TaxID=2980104 RepID=A0ABT3CS91_9BACT|nr:ABC transporter ATP-binding protein [Reichenbachiella ulvae]MCV9386423.1 ABC transporter ATP-binding protein [Reichenbachiella ulvae]
MIDIKNLSFNYGQKQMLFDQLNLSLPAGHIYGLLGKNGAGKSTLIKMITGLLFPKTGQIEVIDHVPQNRRPDFLQEVYLVTEEFQLPDMSLKRYLNLYSSFYPRFNHENFEQYIQEFQLSMDDKLNAISYGQKKKFLLSFGLATNCRLLLLDEPTNGLDIPSKSQFRKVVASAIHEERSFVISTHQVRDMEHLIDPIIILDEGQIVFFEDFESITQKISMGKTKELPDEGVIYAESTFGQYTIVTENDGENEGNFNLELLFNAVTQNKEKFYQIFNS